ncbi:MAG: helix-turn-helix domain-containing protein [Armatimonadota bacterium]
MTPEAAFGQVLRELRQNAGLSQEKLAEAIDCTRPYISYLENGQYSATISMVFRLADALGLSAAELITRAEALADEPSAQVTRPRLRRGER